MTRQRSIVPPAPPPFWQTEPVASHASKSSGVAKWLTASAAAIATAAIIGILHLRRRSNDLRARERRLRKSLVAMFGPDAAWLSVSSMIERAEESAIAIDAPARAVLERLRAIESTRFGKTAAVQADHQRNDQSA